MIFNITHRKMIKIFIKLSLVVTLLGVLFATTQAQKKLTYDELDKYIEKSVEDYDMPGLAIGIIKNNEIALYRIKEETMKDPKMRKNAS